MYEFIIYCDIVLCFIALKILYDLAKNSWQYFCVLSITVVFITFVIIIPLYNWIKL